ncbi:MAG TPA: hypothetical protein VEO95_11990 [Chthoniobacteraceae bacterium]|nr:hypothetical protein [Chthoniobacteraceae bacterium]
MSIRTEAEENLRVIRSLMEKATVYRAISAPGALVGGLGAIAIAVHGIWLSHRSSSVLLRFALPWLGLLVITAGINIALLAREALRRGDPFFSPGMRLALRAMLPALLGGGAAALAFGLSEPEMLACLWVLFYGISLLAAAHFAPKSICWLGRAFFVAGFLLLACTPFVGFWPKIGDIAAVAHGIMGATFGLFHLVYAVCTWPRNRAAETTGGEP